MSKAAPNPEIGRPRWAYLLHCAVLAVFCIGLLRLEFKINPVQPFDGDAPGVREYAAMKRTFGSDQSLVFQITPEHGAVFTNDSLNVISAVTGRAWSIPYASRVLSIANFPHVSAEGDSISVQSLASAKTPRNPEQRRALGQLATDDPRIRDLLVSHDQSSAAVHVTLQFGEADDNAVATVMAAANRIRDEYASDAYRIAIAGAVPERHRATTNGSSGTRHVGLFVVITTIFMSLVLCFSISLAAATCAALALATFATLGLLGWLEIQLAPGSAAGIALLLVVGYAHLMRVNLRYSRNLGQGAADRAAHDALHAHFGPVSITTFALCIGLGSLALFKSTPLQGFGLIAALGVLLMWYVTFFLYGAILRRIDPGSRALPAWLEKASGRVFAVSHRRPIPALALAMIVCAVLIASGRAQPPSGTPRLASAEEVSFLDGKEGGFARADMAGPKTLEFVVRSGSEGGALQPAFLQLVDEFARWLRLRRNVIHVTSLTDTLKMLDGVFRGDQRPRPALPESAALAAQLVLAHDLSVPYGHDLGTQLDIGHSSVRVTAQLAGLSSAEIRQLAQESLAWFSDRSPPAARLEPTGAGLVLATVTEDIKASLVFAAITASVLAAVALYLACSSWRIAMMSAFGMLPPVVVGLFLWEPASALFGGYALLVMVLSVGIIVDNAVHFSFAYHDARERRGTTCPNAIESALGWAGPVGILTAAILTLAFIVLAASTPGFSATLGSGPLAMVWIALLVNYLMLPAVLTILRPSAPGKNSRINGDLPVYESP